MWRSTPLLLFRSRSHSPSPSCRFADTFRCQLLRCSIQGTRSALFSAVIDLSHSAPNSHDTAFVIQYLSTFFVRFVPLYSEQYGPHFTRSLSRSRYFMSCHMYYIVPSVSYVTCAPCSVHFRGSLVEIQSEFLQPPFASDLTFLAVSRVASIPLIVGFLCNMIK